MSGPRFIVAGQLRPDMEIEYSVVDTTLRTENVAEVLFTVPGRGVAAQVCEALNQALKVEQLTEDLRAQAVAHERARAQWAARSDEARLAHERAAAELRESAAEWKRLAESCQAGTVKVTDDTLDGWVDQLRGGNDVIFGHSEAGGLAAEIERLRAEAGS